jgi:hypothetical protein
MRDRTEPYNARQHTESSPLFGLSPVVSSDQNRTKRYQDKINQDVHCTILAFTLYRVFPTLARAADTKDKAANYVRDHKGCREKGGAGYQQRIARRVGVLPGIGDPYAKKITENRPHIRKG